MRRLFILAVVVATGLTTRFVIGQQADVRVLFVGNSFTHGNDMPRMVMAIGEAQGTTIDVEMIAPGGRHLIEHAGDQDVTQLLESGDFDYVVLQEQSEIPGVPSRFASESIPAGRRIAQLAEVAGTEVIVYQTWAHWNGNAYTGHDSYEAMQQQIILSYDALAAAIGAEVAPVGMAWRLASPSESLYAADGRHASPAGSYLAALVLTTTIIDAPIDNAGDYDEDGISVDGDTASRLAGFASRFTQAPGGR